MCAFLHFLSYTWRWQESYGSVKFVWRGNDKSIVGQQSTASVDCSNDQRYSLDITLTTSQVLFHDDTCGALSLAENLGTSNNLYVYLGADNDHGTAEWLDVAMFGTRNWDDAPTLLPTISIKPTVLPTPGPSMSPQSYPTSPPAPKPSTSPHPDPTPGPSTSPHSYPTRLPLSEPSMLPYPGPTLSPVLTPSQMPIVPTVVPTKHPLIDPTTSPTGGGKPYGSLNPIPKPSSEPSPMPSATDTVRVAISLGITVDSIDDASEAVVVPAVVAILDGISEKDVKDYAISTDSIQQRRKLSGRSDEISKNREIVTSLAKLERLHSDAFRRGRQLSLGATATLDIQVSLSTAGNKDATSFLDRVNSELEASVRFVENFRTSDLSRIRDFSMMTTYTSTPPYLILLPSKPVLPSLRALILYHMKGRRRIFDVFS